MKEVEDLTIKELEEVLNLKKKKKKGGRFSKAVVTAIVFLNVVFTVAVLYAFLQTGTEPMALIGAWFAFTTVELWSLSKIKRDEIKEEI